MSLATIAARQLLESETILVRTHVFADICLRDARRNPNAITLRFDALDVIYTTPSHAFFRSFDVTFRNDGWVFVRRLEEPRRICEWIE